MATATIERIELPIGEIEDRLAELGYDTEYHGDDDGTQFFISIGGKQIVIHDGVSGDYFRPGDISFVVQWVGVMDTNLTERFEEVETVPEFIDAVQETVTVL